MPNPFSRSHGELKTFDSLLLHTREALEQLARCHHKEMDILSRRDEIVLRFPPESPEEACLEKAEEAFGVGSPDQVFLDELNHKTQMPSEQFHAMEYELPEDSNASPTSPRSPRVSFQVSADLRESASTRYVLQTQSSQYDLGHASEVATSGHSTDDAIEEDLELEKSESIESHRMSVAFTPRSPWSQFPEYRRIKLGEFHRFNNGGARTTDLMRRSKGHAVNHKRFFLQRLMSHPQSLRRSSWIIVSMIFLIYDFVMVPVTLCFILEPTPFTDSIGLISTVFWTCDIPLTFFTGVMKQSEIEMRPQEVARKYLSWWFWFDLILVMQDWLTFAISNDDISSLSLLRGARWLRLIRLLRLARLIRFAKFRPLLRQIVFRFHVTFDNISLTMVCINYSALMILSLHLNTCFWHLLGEALDDGWIKVNGFETATVARRYLISLRWTCTRLHGIASGNTIESPLETLADSLLVLASVVATAVYISQMTVISMTWVGSMTFFKRRIAAAFIKRYGISWQLRDRLMRVLKASTYEGAGELVADEARLLENLPKSLQEDLLFEARSPVLCHKCVFNDMFSLNQRTVRNVCNKALSVHVAVKSEVLFAYGDACLRMLFIISGKCYYMHRATMHMAIEDLVGQAKSTKSRKSESRGTKQSDQEQVSYSEPTLWTTWEHRGTLVAKDESILLSLDAIEFGNVIIQYQDARIHAVKYANHFVWLLNSVERSALNDLVDFNELTFDELDKGFTCGNEGDHFMFISHYKVEAGTEATLMRDLLDPILKAHANHPANNLRSPVFIDSEDLVDLAKLKEHVKKSGSLVLLLTPKVLSRPWCLVEIVTAIRNNVQVVPVEVQRPGCQYEYPNDIFYADLLAGKFLDESSANLLATEGLQLEDVASAIRQVFLKIALPFSPHKSKKIRNAELEDIIQRCNVRCNGTPRSATSPAFGRSQSFNKIRCSVSL